MQRPPQPVVLASVLAVLVSLTTVAGGTLPEAAATERSSTGALATASRHDDPSRHQQALSLSAKSHPVPAGATVPVVVTVSNSGTSPLRGTVSATVPDRWHATPRTAEFGRLDPNEDHLVVFEVTVPAGADPANYPVEFVATSERDTAAVTASVPVDPIPVTVTAVSQEATELGHPKEYLADRYSSTKWLTLEKTGWAELRLSEPFAVTEYSLTAADDFPDRDPAQWTLSGSNDGGENWTVLDTRSEEVFPERHHTHTYRLENNAAYRTYRIKITKNNGGPVLQLAELTLNTLPSAASSSFGESNP